MASHLLTEYITWSKSYQSLRSLESWNRGTCSSCAWLSFLIGHVCSQVWCSPYLAANFGVFELQTFPWSPSKVEVGTFYPFTLKVGSKHSFIILKALVWSQQLKLAPLKSANRARSYYVSYCRRGLHGHLSHTKVSEPFVIHPVLSYFLKRPWVIFNPIPGIKTSFCCKASNPLR